MITLFITLFGRQGCAVDTVIPDIRKVGKVRTPGIGNLCAGQPDAAGVSEGVAGDHVVMVLAVKDDPAFVHPAPHFVVDDQITLRNIAVDGVQAGRVRHDLPRRIHGQTGGRVCGDGANLPPRPRPATMTTRAFFRSSGAKLRAVRQAVWIGGLGAAVGETANRLPADALTSFELGLPHVPSTRLWAI